MAKITQKTKWRGDVKKVEAPKTEEVKTEPVANPADISAIMEELKQLRKETEELKKWKWDSFKKWKEKLQWPRDFRFKMWGWVPIISMESFKKDPTKDLIYKNQNGILTSNHYVRIKLVDDKEHEVEVIDFGRDVTLSEFMNARNQYWEIIDLDNQKMTQTFTFDTKERWSFTILPSLIN